MRLPRTIAEVIDKHVTLELECLDRVSQRLSTASSSSFSAKHRVRHAVP